jgi:ketosteroid isomerase-like protein
MAGKSVARASWMTCLLFVCACGVGLTAEKRSKTSDADAVIATEMARGEALTKGDTTAISRMTAEEFFEITRLGTLRGKPDNMRDLSSGDLKLTTVKYDSLTVKTYGDVAILRGIADNTGTYRGFPFAGKIRYMRIFVKRDGRWQAVAMQHTPIQ